MVGWPTALLRVRACLLLAGLVVVTSQQFGVVLLCCPACSPGAKHLRACPRSERLLTFPGTPVLGHLRGSLHDGYSLAVPSFHGHCWSGLVWTHAFGGFRSVSSRYRGPVLGCQSVVVSACVASRLGSVSEVRGGSACRPSTLWRSEVAVLMSCVWPDLGWWSWRCAVLFRYLVVPYCSNPYWVLFARLTPLLPSARGSSSQELGVRQVAEAAVASCVVSSSESEGCCSCCCAACVESVVTRRVRAVAARLVLDSLAVVFLMWRTLLGKSSLVLAGCELWLRCIAWLPYVLVRFPRTICCCPGEGFSQDCFVLVSAVAVLPQSLRCAVGLAGAFWESLWSFAPHAAESVLHVFVPQGLRPAWPVVPFQAWGPLRVAFGGSLHRVLMPECFGFVLSGALVHCVAPWVAPGFELSASGTLCAGLCLVVEQLPLRGGYFALSSCFGFHVAVRGVGVSGSQGRSLLSVRLVTVRPIGLLVLDYVTMRMVWVRPSGESGYRFRMLRFLRVCCYPCWTMRKQLCALSGFAGDRVAGRLVPSAGSIGGYSRAVFGWRFLPLRLALASLGTCGVVVPLHDDYSLTVSSFRGRRWSGLVRTRASGGFRSVSSRETSFSLGCSVVSAGVLRVVSALCPTPLVSSGVVCVAQPRLVVMALRYSLPLLSSTLL
ncbi:hypothetical protein Taro_033192 [Colocasia esculenta]|uniref:Uncharacterized protein n=1 Tax=Colocasia esculenta TaxID=4460 RepID=A0A843VZF9_COLES|nr:hypothetical protein [Colocasia esculenta]